MRSLLLAAVAMLAVPACSNDITGGSGGTSVDAGGGGGGDGGDTCTCPDGTIMQGDDCATSCPAEQTPEADLVSLPSGVGSASAPVDLNVETDVAITATSVMGFTGDVNLTVTAADGDGNAVASSDWGLIFDNGSDTMPVTIDTAGGSAVAHLQVLGNGTAALGGMITVTASAGSATTTTQIPVTFSTEFRVDFTDDGSENCVYPLGHATTATAYTIKAGRTLAVYNMNTGAKGFVIHSNLGDASGFPHEAQTTPGTLPGAAYSGSGPLTSGTTQFYCHTGVTNTMGETTAEQANRPYLTIQ